MNTKINMSKEIEDLWQSLKLSTSTSSEIQANMKAACELDVQVSCQFANRIYVCFDGLKGSLTLYFAAISTHVMEIINTLKVC